MVSALTVDVSENANGTDVFSTRCDQCADAGIHDNGSQSVVHQQNKHDPDGSNNSQVRVPWQEIGLNLLCSYMQFQ
jgi:hypothetical protein